MFSFTTFTTCYLLPVTTFTTFTTCEGSKGVVNMTVLRLCHSHILSIWEVCYVILGLCNISYGKGVWVQPITMLSKASPQFPAFSSTCHLTTIPELATSQATGPAIQPSVYLVILEIKNKSLVGDVR